VEVSKMLFRYHGGFELARTKLVRVAGLRDCGAFCIEIQYEKWKKPSIKVKESYENAKT